MSTCSVDELFTGLEVATTHVLVVKTGIEVLRQKSKPQKQMGCSTSMYGTFVSVYRTVRHEMISNLLPSAVKHRDRKLKQEIAKASGDATAEEEEMRRASWVANTTAMARSNAKAAAVREKTEALRAEVDGNGRVDGGSECSRSQDLRRGNFKQRTREFAFIAATTAASNGCGRCGRGQSRRSALSHGRTASQSRSPAEGARGSVAGVLWGGLYCPSRLGPSEDPPLVTVCSKVPPLGEC